MLWQTSDFNVSWSWTTEVRFDLIRVHRYDWETWIYTLSRLQKAHSAHHWCTTQAANAKHFRKCTNTGQSSKATVDVCLRLQAISGVNCHMQSSHWPRHTDSCVDSSFSRFVSRQDVEWWRRSLQSNKGSSECLQVEQGNVLTTTWWWVSKKSEEYLRLNVSCCG